MKHPELLIPASSLEVLKTAVMFGADAVYIGGEAFGLRAKAKNFSMEEIREGIAFAHAHDVKVYITANILAHNGDLSGVRAYFEELKEILDGVKLDNKMGVCMDTCHIYDGGYDIVNDLDGVLDEFDRIIGLDRLKAIHMNDSKNPFASHKDRHEKIGEGSIGFDTMVKIINHPKLQGIPILLETPNELDGYKKEIQMLRKSYTM